MEQLRPAARTQPAGHAESRARCRDSGRLPPRRGESFDDAANRLREEHPELAHLDGEKAMGLRRYVGEDANMINDTLRGGDQIDRDYLNPDINVLRAAVEDMPRVDTTETPRVFRDIGLTDEELNAALARYKPGEDVQESGFTSASKDVPPEYFGDRGDNQVRFIIEQPQNARDLESTNPEEREVLWGNDHRFGVKSVEGVTAREWVIRLIDREGN